MDFIHFGESIRKYRQIQGLTQEELAEIIDCSGSHIGQIENSRGVPSLELKVKIANALHTTVDSLLNGSFDYPEIVLLRDVRGS